MVETAGQPNVPKGTKADALKPLVKWPGGKRWLVPILQRLQPASFGRYYEPFAGGAAAYFGLRPTCATLGDVNASLILTYRSVARSPKEVLQHLQRYSSSSDEYYRVRALQPSSDAEAAARLLYLARYSFNGLYRVNKKGEFNVPYGGKHRQKSYSESELLTYAGALRNVKLVAGDFRTVLRTVRENDFVYADPPYTVSHNSNGFIKYNDKLFGWADQVALAHLCKRLASNGVHLIVSNADHDCIRQLYEPEFDSITLKRYSSVSATKHSRAHVSERLFLSGSLAENCCSAPVGNPVETF